jgi:hypothetical protein
LRDEDRYGIHRQGESDKHDGGEADVVGVREDYRDMGYVFGVSQCSVDILLADRLYLSDRRLTTFLFYSVTRQYANPKLEDVGSRDPKTRFCHIPFRRWENACQRL